MLPDKMVKLFWRDSLVVNAVESIINQTYDDWDLLIVDDASTDGTSELLQSLAVRDARIKIGRAHV